MASRASTHRDRVLRPVAGSGRVHVHQEVLEHEAVQSQEGASVLDVPDGPFKCGDALPLVCGIAEVARVLNVSLTHAHRLRKSGRLEVFELPRLSPDADARYSGSKLLAYASGQLRALLINGQIDRPRVFGRKRVG